MSGLPKTSFIMSLISANAAVASRAPFLFLGVSPEADESTLGRGIDTSHQRHLMGFFFPFRSSWLMQIVFSPQGAWSIRQAALAEGVLQVRRHVMLVAVDEDGVASLVRAPYVGDGLKARRGLAFSRDVHPPEAGKSFEPAGQRLVPLARLEVIAGQR